MKDKIITRSQHKKSQPHEVINLDSDDEQDIIKNVQDNLQLLLMFNQKIQGVLEKPTEEKANGNQKKIEIQEKQPEQMMEECSSQYSSYQSEESSISFKNLLPEEKESKKKPFSGLKAFLLDEPTQPNSSLKNSNQKNEQKEEMEIPLDQISSPSLIPDDESELDQNKRARHYDDVKLHPAPQKKHLPKELIKLQEQIEGDFLAKKSEVELEQEMKKIGEKRIQQKKQNKKRDYLIEKKYKEMKKGKKKDRVSNELFNAIEDYFM